ncbi:MAG: hypothetical protein EZS28_038424, partial [Streblomastix strix]
MNKWHGKFLEGNPLVSIAVLPGRPPITGLGPDFEKIIQEDKYITLARLAAIFGIAKETVRRIIIDETSYKSKHSIHTSLNHSGRDAEGDSIDERPRHFINDLKVMLTTFWNSEHVFVVHWTPFQTTMNATMFAEDVLKLLQKQVKKEHNTKTIQHHIHIDNAAIHRANYTQNFISKGIFKPMKHFSFSPDLAPSDFYLFTNLMKLLKGCDFKTEEELHAVQKYLEIGLLTFYNLRTHKKRCNKLNLQVDLDDKSQQDEQFRLLLDLTHILWIK